jgi:hypothetical protein
MSYNTGLMQNGIRELHRISDAGHVTGVIKRDRDLRDMLTYKRLVER